MSKKQKKIFWPTLLAVAITSSALAFASARAGHPARTAGAKPFTVQNTALATGSDQTSYVHRGALWPKLRWNLKALGDRIEKPGKERLTLTGTLTRAADPQPVPVVAILEFPDRLRLTMQIGAQTQILTFNGRQAQALGVPLDVSEQDSIETMVYDTAEHFFGARSRGTATRFLGDHFRLDDGTQTNYTGPFYDVYETNEQINSAIPARPQPKLYFFDSDTLLLDRVRYELERGGTQISVEIQISKWQNIQGQQVPTQIVRSENNRSVLTLTFTSAALSPKLEDGIFG